MNKIKQLLEIKLVRFIIVGVFNTALDIALLNIFIFVFNLDEIPANAIAVLIAVSVSYVLNQKFVFRYKEPLSLRKYGQFLLVTGVSLLIIQSIIIKLFVDVIPFPGDIAKSIGNIFGLSFSDRFYDDNSAKIIATAASMVWNYLFYNKFVFAKKTKNKKKK